MSLCVKSLGARRNQIEAMMQLRSLVCPSPAAAATSVVFCHPHQH